MDRKTPAGGAGGEGEDDRQTERQVSDCLGRAPRGPTRVGLAFASARDPSLRDLRVHTIESEDSQYGKYRLKFHID